MRYLVWFSSEHREDPGYNLVVARDGETAACDFADQWHEVVDGGSHEGSYKVMVRSLEDPYPPAEEFEVVQEIKFVVAHS